MNTENLEVEKLKDVRTVLQPGHNHPVFVVGWTQDGQPAKTAKHQQRDGYSRALAARAARGNGLAPSETIS